MKETYLIQRLKKPFEPTTDERRKIMQRFGDAFAFGGGLRNGGLTNEAMDLLRSVFRFDYMGSSEFEWGAIPKALSKIVENKDNYVVGYLGYENGKKVWYICDINDELEVQARIEMLAIDERQFRLKEQCGLKRVLEGKSEWLRDVCGWLELNNGFMFFTDEEMAEKVVKLFGLDK